MHPKGALRDEIETNQTGRRRGAGHGVASMTGATIEPGPPRPTPFPGRPGHAPSGGMDRVIRRNWLQKNGSWVAVGLVALVCTLALLWISRDSPRVLKINEGRIVVSTVRQGQFDDFIPVRAQVTPLRALELDPERLAQRRRSQGGRGNIARADLEDAEDELAYYRDRSNTDVVRSLLWQFSKPVLIDNLLAWPAAWYFLQSWLGNVPYRIELSPLPFLAAGALALIIACGTVLKHARRRTCSDRSTNRPE